MVMHVFQSKILWDIRKLGSFTCQFTVYVAEANAHNGSEHKTI